MTVSKRTRFEVLKRDNHTCRYCGATAPDAVLTVDHVIPTALGGNDDPGNLVAACRDCNFGKASTSPDAAVVEDVRAIDVQWASAIRRAAAVRQRARKRRLDYCRAFESEWSRCGGRPSDIDALSVERLYAAGLPKAEMLDAVSAALLAWNVRDRFAYFMGICWRTLGELQDTAKQLLEADGRKP